MKYFIIYKKVNINGVIENRVHSQSQTKQDLPEDYGFFHYDESVCGNVCDSGMPMRRITENYGPTHFDFLTAIGWKNLRISAYNMESNLLFTAYRAGVEHDGDTEGLENPVFATWRDKVDEIKLKYPKG